MNGFVPQASKLPSASLDPTKHVNYNLGMVLGVDDFTQEFTYLAGRDQWLARDLLGYGTVCGLNVTIELKNGRPEVAVSPGVALTPQGQLVMVSRSQCALLNEWLNLHKREVLDRQGSPPLNPLVLYVVLGYHDCPTDPVPIPGEPCRSEDNLMASSRLTDDFTLELRFVSPDQREENAIRDFVKWLEQVEITSVGPFPDLADFLAALRDATRILQSPPSSPLSPPDFMYNSPPASLKIPADQACDYLRAAMRLWTTELRPLWQGKGPGKPPDETSILLAELQLPLAQTNDTWTIADPSLIVVEQRDRPFLIHLRMLQEWLECGRFGSVADLNGDVKGSITNTIVTAIQNLPVNFTVRPTEDQILTFKGGQWVAANPPAPSLPTLNGDVIGNLTSNSLDKLQTKPISASSPAAGQVLTFDGTQWQPATPATVSGNFVDHTAITYSIVAAGRVQGDGSVTAPVYNNLRVDSLGNGAMTLLFDGYTQPDGSFQYIVKAILVMAESFIKIPLVFFQQFLPTGKGFVLQVQDGNNPVSADALKKLEVMVEVSRFKV